jgi:hypothetical protein
LKTVEIRPSLWSTASKSPRFDLWAATVRDSLPALAQRDILHLTDRRRTQFWWLRFSC